jgi:hypothetical protein
MPHHPYRLKTLAVGINVKPGVVYLERDACLSSSLNKTVRIPGHSNFLSYQVSRIALLAPTTMRIFCRGGGGGGELRGLKIGFFGLSPFLDF